MVKIAFHDNCLCERGTTVSLYDYAYYNKHYLGNESIIMYIGNDQRNHPEVLDKFKKEFTLRPYIDWQQEADQILKEEKCDILYMQKAGEWDGKNASSSVCKSIIHCVFNTQYKHGDVYGRISNCFGNNHYPVVNYMVNLPNVDTNMRNELNIPDNAIVFGRHGGIDQFNIKYVHQVIDKVTDEYPNVYFLMVNTEIFCREKANIIHHGKIIDLHKKVEFINTCDAMIHARHMGETFGAAVSEFSSKNKPVITCRKGNDLAHLDIMKDKCFTYENEKEVYDIFKKFITELGDIKKQDWNGYSEYGPEKIMDKFNELFIQPCEFDVLINLEKLDLAKPTDLCCIMGKFKSDKGSINITESHHNYSIIYNELFKDIRFRKLNIFELGIGTINQRLVSHMPPNGFSGASLYAWREYFPNSNIYGGDIDTECLFDDERIKTFVCDQTDPLSIKNLWNQLDSKEKMDIIIEDGLHTFEANIMFFENSIHRLNKGGIYIVEDIDCKPYNNGLFHFKQKLPELKIKYPDLTFQLLEIPCPGKKTRSSDNTLLIVKKKCI
jgi:hypothetical protein